LISISTLYGSEGWQFLTKRVPGIIWATSATTVCQPISGRSTSLRRVRAFRDELDAWRLQREVLLDGETGNRDEASVADLSAATGMDVPAPDTAPRAGRRRVFAFAVLGLATLGAGCSGRRESPNRSDWITRS